MGPAPSRMSLVQIPRYLGPRTLAPVKSGMEGSPGSMKDFFLEVRNFARSHDDHGENRS